MNDLNIPSQTAANKEGLKWGRQFQKGPALQRMRESLISNRIKLKHIEYANSVNAAAAVFGESQVGKSYMVDCLLTSERSPLTIYDAKGTATGFLESINPTGGGKEATALISRFTTKKVWRDDEFPVGAALLSPIDIVCVIIDTYFNDVIGTEFPGKEGVEAEIERLSATYGTQPEQQDIITEDEVIELRDYFNSGLLDRGEAFRIALKETRYFEHVAEIISRVSVERWVDVFGFLWNASATRELTDVFNKLVNLLRRLDFSQKVYIKTAAVLRAEGTILDVDRLFELFGVESVSGKNGQVEIKKARVPEMVVLTETGKTVSGVSKGEFCALAMEVDFTIVNPLEDSGELLKEKPFLNDLDLLDFPGARSRLKTPVATIDAPTACQLMTRGKVAYLFNKYSQQYLISNLLFCYHDKQSEVATLSSLLQGWVEGTVGKTAAERSDFMRTAEISPLFIVGTKFNLDMVQNPDDSKGTEQERFEKLQDRWKRRFGNLKKIISPSSENDWFENWTGDTPKFNNLYLLRSFEYSCQGGLYDGYQEKVDDGSGHKIWKIRYKEDGTMCGEESVNPDYVQFFKDLYANFTQNDFVQQHFPATLDPGENQIKSWSEVTKVKHDGSAWIIENLTRSGKKASESRRNQFDRLKKECFHNLCATLGQYFHDDSSDAQLRETVNDAGRITLLLDALFGSDKYFFSEFIDKLVIRESELNDLVLKTIHDNALITETDMSMLFAIRNRCHIDNAVSEEENRRRIRETYSIDTDQALDAFLATMKLTVDMIINVPKVRNLAQIIVDDIESFWLEHYLALENFQEFVDRGMPQEYIERLLNKMTTLYRTKLRVAEKMTDRIHKYVVDPTRLDSVAEMIADICAEMLNSFINTFGTSYFKEEGLWDSVRKTVQQNKFDLNVEDVDYNEVEFDEIASRKGLNELFDVYDHVDTLLNTVPVDTARLQHFSNYKAYHDWTNNMKIGFLAVCDQPDYDQRANEALRNLLVENIIDKPEMVGMLADEDFKKYHMTTLRKAAPMPASEAGVETASGENA